MNKCAFVIDQSASVVIKSEIIMRAGSDKLISINWGFDAEGEPTTNANISLKNSMTSSGGYKGFGVGLLVEFFRSTEWCYA